MKRERGEGEGGYILLDDGSRFGQVWDVVRCDVLASGRMDLRLALESLERILQGNRK